MPAAKPALPGALVLTALVVLGGCVAPAPAEPPGEARLSSHAGRGAATGPTCDDLTFLTDERAMREGGTARSRFHLDTVCDFTVNLTVRLLNGKLKVSVDGPGGWYWEEVHEGLEAYPAFAGTKRSTGRPGGVNGQYEVLYDAEGTAQFKFTVTGKDRP